MCYLDENNNNHSNNRWHFASLNKIHIALHNENEFESLRMKTTIRKRKSATAQCLCVSRQLSYIKSVSFR